MVPGRGKDCGVKTADCIPSYLQMTADMIRHRPKGFTYASLFDFGLVHGKPMTPVPNARDYAPKGEPRQCYMNSTLLAFESRRFIYCEGWALSVIPIPHAWNLIQIRGKWYVVDSTWKEPSKEYFGVAFKTAYLKEAMRKQKYYGLIDAFCSGWPLLQLKPSQDGKWKHRVMDKL